MKRRFLLLILCLSFLGIGVYGGWQLLSRTREYRAAEDTYRDLAQYVRIAQPVPQELEEPEAPEQPTPGQAESEEAPTEPEDAILWPQVDFEALQQRNPDIVAWIYLEGTAINYPVVQGSNNSYYLRRLFDGSYNNAGTLFMDYRNTEGFLDRNTVFYGHNMQNGSMFADLPKFESQAYYEAHPTALVMTPDGNYRLEFFAGYTTHVTDDAWKMFFGSDEEFAQWLRQAGESSDFESGIQPTAQDRLITLSTCTYAYSDARYVLVGVLREV